MIDTTIATALIIAVPTVIATSVVPIFLAILTNGARRAEKIEEYARQDLVTARTQEVAKQAAEAASLLAARQDDAAAQAAIAAKLLLAANERVAASAKATNNKLDTIHTLVNSNMTAAMQSELDATVRELAVMMELIELKKGMGTHPSVDTLAALKSANDKIVELGAVLRDRLHGAAATPPA
jgi:hypothetical protein